MSKFIAFVPSDIDTDVKSIPNSSIVKDNLTELAAHMYNDDYLRSIQIEVSSDSKHKSTTSEDGSGSSISQNDESYRPAAFKEAAYRELLEAHYFLNNLSELLRKTEYRSSNKAVYDRYLDVGRANSASVSTFTLASRFNGLVNHTTQEEERLAMSSTINVLRKISTDLKDTSQHIKSQAQLQKKFGLELQFLSKKGFIFIEESERVKYMNLTLNNFLKGGSSYSRLNEGMVPQYPLQAFYEKPTLKQLYLLCLPPGLNGRDSMNIATSGIIPFAHLLSPVFLNQSYSGLNMAKSPVDGDLKSGIAGDRFTGSATTSGALTKLSHSSLSSAGVAEATLEQGSSSSTSTHRSLLDSAISLLSPIANGVVGHYLNLDLWVCDDASHSCPPFRLIGSFLPKISLPIIESGDSRCFEEDPAAPSEFVMKSIDAFVSSTVNLLTFQELRRTAVSEIAELRSCGIISTRVKILHENFESRTESGQVLNPEGKRKRVLDDEYENDDNNIQECFISAISESPSVVKVHFSFPAPPVESLSFTSFMLSISVHPLEDTPTVLNDEDKASWDIQAAVEPVSKVLRESFYSNSGNSLLIRDVIQSLFIRG